MVLNGTMLRDWLVCVARTTDRASRRHRDGSAGECQSRGTVDGDLTRHWP
jgi:hypothetical protein